MLQSSISILPSSSSSLCIYNRYVHIHVSTAPSEQIFPHSPFIPSLSSSPSYSINIVIRTPHAYRNIHSSSHNPRNGSVAVFSFSQPSPRNASAVSTQQKRPVHRINQRASVVAIVDAFSPIDTSWEMIYWIHGLGTASHVVERSKLPGEIESKLPTAHSERCVSIVWEANFRIPFS